MERLDAHLDRKHFSGEFALPEEEYSLDYTWRKQEFINAHITGGSLMGSLFEDCVFNNTIFENVFIDDVDFVRCHFDNFKIINCSREGMEMRECTGNPPTLIGTKAPRPGWEDKTLPPGWGPETDGTKR
ncbi:MAG: hypothetical protein WCX29_03570 [Candidatus Peribacteraceae bacterium]